MILTIAGSAAEISVFQIFSTLMSMSVNDTNDGLTAEVAV